MVETRTSGASGAIAKTEGSYVDWSPVIAGAVTSAALFFLLMTFGSALGLSVVSPWSMSNPSARTVTIAAGIWMVLVQVGSFALGGYLAGRMRRRWADAPQDEVEFRDGVHGALVWAVGLLFSALLVAWTAAALLSAGVQGGTAAAAAAGSRGTGTDATGYAIDTLFRAPNRPPAQGEDIRAEATRILARSAARGELPAADRTYLAQLVAARTGLNPQDAERRVNDVVAQAKQAADTARRTAVWGGFTTAASLLVSLAAAWVAAVTGGKNRDQNIVWRGFRTVRDPRYPLRD